MSLSLRFPVRRRPLDQLFRHTVQFLPTIAFLPSRPFGLQIPRRGLASGKLRISPVLLIGRVVKAAVATVVAGADGRKHAGFRERERNNLFHDAQNQFRAGADVQLLEQAIQVGVGGVFGDGEPAGNPFLRQVVEHGLNDLDLALGHAQGLPDFVPCVVAKHCCSTQFAMQDWSSSGHANH